MTARVFMKMAQINGTGILFARGMEDIIHKNMKTNGVLFILHLILIILL